MIYPEDKYERCERLAHFMLDNDATVRFAAAHFGVSKSTVHKDVSSRLACRDPALYERVRLLLEKNKAERHLRGGEATRQKYLLLEAQK